MNLVRFKITRCILTTLPCSKPHIQARLKNQIGLIRNGIAKYLNGSNSILQFLHLPSGILRRCRAVSRKRFTSIALRSAQCNFSKHWPDQPFFTLKWKTGKKTYPKNLFISSQTVFKIVAYWNLSCELYLGTLFWRIHKIIRVLVVCFFFAFFSDRPTDLKNFKKKSVLRKIKFVCPNQNIEKKTNWIRTNIL